MVAVVIVAMVDVVALGILTHSRIMPSTYLMMVVEVVVVVAVAGRHAPVLLMLPPLPS